MVEVSPVQKIALVPELIEFYVHILPNFGLSPEDQAFSHKMIKNNCKAMCIDLKRGVELGTR